MKNFFKKTLSVIMVICSIFTFSITTNATDKKSGALSIANDILDIFIQENYNLIEYDCMNKTERIISTTDITNYANFAKTTYELPAMIEKQNFIVDCIEDDLILPTSIYDNTPFILTPPKTNNVINNPYSGIVYLYVKGKDKNNQPAYYRGTGFMVAPDVMVTAMHNFLDKYHTTEEFRIYPYIHETTNSFLSTNEYVRPAKWVYLQNYADSIKQGTSDWYAYDWCVVKLEKPISDTYCFNITHSIPPNLQGSFASVSGYSACLDLACGRGPNCTHETFYHTTSSGMIMVDSDHKIYYTNNTTGGCSGGPVYNASTKVCYAIHTTSINSAIDYETQYAKMYNGGVSISTTLFNCISEYISM